jgi:hypothetical protein
MDEARNMPKNIHRNIRQVAAKAHRQLAAIKE